MEKISCKVKQIALSRKEEEINPRNKTERYNNPTKGERMRGN